jgi:hypothetical protein
MNLNSKAPGRQCDFAAILGVAQDGEHALDVTLLLSHPHDLPFDEVKPPYRQTRS